MPVKETSVAVKPVGGALAGTGTKILISSIPMSVTPWSLVAVNLIFVAAELPGRGIDFKVHVPETPMGEGASAADQVDPPSSETYTINTSAPEVFVW